MMRRKKKKLSNIDGRVMIDELQSGEFLVEQSDYGTEE